LLIECLDERFEIQWDNEAKVTPMGSLVFFAQYVKAGGLLDRLSNGYGERCFSPSCMAIRSFSISLDGLSGMGMNSSVALPRD
jgi:hypothetical protein